jgi:mannose-6-phosphate isomerase-like protein (cupin superfamily)
VTTRGDEEGREGDRSSWRDDTMADKRAAYHLGAGDGKAILVVGDVNVIKVSGEDTDDAYTVWVNIVAPGNGPPPHVHHREHEDFFVLDGEFEIVREGQEPLRASTGDFVHTPKGVMHTYRNIGSSEGRLLALAVPAGIERFFAEVGELVDGATRPRPLSGEPPREEIERLARAAEKYGIELRLPAGG